MTRAQFFRIYNRFSQLRSAPTPPSYKKLVSFAKLIGSTRRLSTVPRNKPPYRVH